MIEKESIENAIGTYMEDHGLVLVEVKNNKSNNIKIFFDAIGRAVTIDDCADLSRHIESRLDREIEDYSLMVSSAGIE